MARNIATLLLLFAYGSCMEMRETVERMVMVRTTGSDLQPAATGYIYKKESDGPASVTKMGPGEVIEHFSKIYGQPEPYKESATPAKPSYSKDEDEDKAASYANEEHVKPVVEVSNDEDHIDGIADEDYDKMFEEYAKRYGNYRSDFTDYLHGKGGDHDAYHLFKDDPYESYKERGFGSHDLEKDGDGHYDTQKVTGYSVTKSEKYKHGIDEHGKLYDQNHESKEDDYDKGETIDRFQRDFDKDKIKKDDDFYHISHKDGLHTHAIGSLDYGSDPRGHQNGDYHESKHYNEGHDKKGDRDHDEDSSKEGGEPGHDSHRSFGIREPHAVKGYRYEIKH